MFGGDHYLGFCHRLNHGVIEQVAQKLRLVIGGDVYLFGAGPDLDAEDDIGVL